MSDQASGSAPEGGAEGNAIQIFSFSNNRRRSRESDSPSVGEFKQYDGDDYEYTESGHAKQVLLGLNELRKDGTFCDVTLSVESVKFPAHRNVLAASSPYFRAMFTTKLAESKQSVVVVNGVEPAMMALLLDYAYTSDITITKTNVQSLLSAANLLQMLPVRDAACSFLEWHMDITNCVGIHCFAEIHACTTLQDRAKQFTLVNFVDVGIGEEFLTLTPQKVVEFISSDDLVVDREETVFQVIIRWYMHAPEQRNVDFHKVLEHVRLPLLSPYFLHDCVENLLVIKSSPQCMDLVEEAKMFHLLPDRRTQISTPRTKLRNNSSTVTLCSCLKSINPTQVNRLLSCKLRPSSCMASGLILEARSSSWSQNNFISYSLVLFQVVDSQNLTNRSSQLLGRKLGPISIQKYL